MAPGSQSRSRRPAWRSGRENFACRSICSANRIRRCPRATRRFSTAKCSATSRWTRATAATCRTLSATSTARSAFPTGGPKANRDTFASSDLNPSTGYSPRPRNSGRSSAGRPPAAGAPCAGDLVRGTDSIGTLTEDDYVGQDNQDPELAPDSTACATSKRSASSPARDARPR